MNEKIEALKSSFDSELKKIANMVDLEALRVNYLGRKGKVTDALKGHGGSDCSFYGRVRGSG